MIRGLDILVCLGCLGPLADESHGDETTVIKCTQCALAYPVVNGVAIMYPSGHRVSQHADTTDDVVSRGPTTASLVRLIRRGRGEQAFKELLRPPNQGRLSEVVRRRLGRIAAVGVAPIERLLVWRWRRGVIAAVADKTAGPDTLIDAVFAWPFDAELAHYFRYRQSQPRYLAALGAIATADDPESAALDLACGAGHLTRHLLARAERPVVAMNHNSLELLIAARVAPGSILVCADGSERLPLKSQSIGMSICSDAFHYLADQELASKELCRVSTHAVLLSRVGNVAIEPTEGAERTLSQYRDLFGDWTTRAFGEEELVSTYISGRSLDASAIRSDETHSGTKWLTILALPAGVEASEGAAFDGWPHASGQLAINPLYRRRGDTGDSYELVYPSDWFKFENRLVESYAPSRIRIPQGLLGEPCPDPDLLADLIAQTIFLGLPLGPATVEPPKTGSGPG